MPKSAPASPQAASIIQPKSPSDDQLSRKLSDIALRKKKNADAQAAFRARRANYISTLEETVTSLESVVLQLQDSCREARTENAALRRDNARLRHDFREREKFWRALCQARKAGQGPDLDDLPPLPPSFTIQSQMAATDSNYPPTTGNLPPEGVDYRAPDDSSLCNGDFVHNSTQGFHTPSPSLSYIDAGDISCKLSGEDVAHSANERIAKFYSYSMMPSGRDGTWSQHMAHAGSSGGDSVGTGNQSASQSPAYIASPITTPELGFVRFPMEEQKVPMNSLDSAPYAFPNSRSLSPSSSTPPSSSSTSLSTSFSFSFPSDSGLAVDRTDFGFRRSSLPHCGTEVTLHGGTADISLAGPGSDAVRYRLGAQRKANNGSDRPLLPAQPPLSGPDDVSRNDRHSSDGGPLSIPRLRSRRGTVPAQFSRSPSPPALSGTLAVIKAQAFGALRRTRARTKKPSGHNTRDILDVAGVGMDTTDHPNSKRARLNHDNNDVYHDLD